MHEQINVITVEPVYLAILEDDGKVWEDRKDRPVFFQRRLVPMDVALVKHDDGVFAYSDRVR